MNVKKSTLKEIIKVIVESVVKEMNAMQDDPNWGDEFSTDNAWVSRCCQMPALGELDMTDPENPVGICRGCQDHATFEPASEDVMDEQGAGAGGGGGGTGASVTGNVSGYNSPGAFRRKKTTENYSAARAGTAGFDPKDPNGRKPWRHIDSGFFEISGKTASKIAGGKLPKHGWERIVKAPTGFPSESGWVWLARTTTGGRQVWSIRQALRDDPYAANKGEKTEAVLYPTAGMEQEGKIYETSTSGAAGAYNVPGCFAKKGGSRKGIAGSEKLGYTLTATGRKDMERSADALLEGKTVNETAMGQLGPKFGAAQRAYDAQSPSEEPEGPECPNCGGESDVIKSQKGPGWWSWEAVCRQCRKKFGDDSF